MCYPSFRGKLRSSPGSRPGRKLTTINLNFADVIVFPWLIDQLLKRIPKSGLYVAESGSYEQLSSQGGRSPRAILFRICLLRTLLSQSALSDFVTYFFSIDYALLPKNTRGWVPTTSHLFATY